MLILGINTCLATADIALVRDGEILATQFDDAPRGHEARLPSLLDMLLADARCHLSDLDRIAVVTGPGSFTGIRIGVAFGRGLALTLTADIVGITALEAGVAPSVTGTVQASLAAQKRPPDRTWWVQTLRDGVGIDAVIETGERDIGKGVAAHPQARWAAMKAPIVSPDTHPPSPTYARLPDAKPMTPPEQ